MPHVVFTSLPPDARLWVFGSSAALSEGALNDILTTTDAFLAQWAAHGAPLHCARDVRDDRFVAVAVDERASGASGCSIDGLFRTLSAVQQRLGIALLPGSNVFWRRADGTIETGSRAEFRAAAAQGAITRDTPVFDLSITTVGEWRETFERPAAESWHGQLLPVAAR